MITNTSAAKMIPARIITVTASAALRFPDPPAAELVIQTSARAHPDPNPVGELGSEFPYRPATAATDLEREPTEVRISDERCEPLVDQRPNLRYCATGIISPEV